LKPKRRGKTSHLKGEKLCGGFKKEVVKKTYGSVKKQMASSRASLKIGIEKTNGKKKKKQNRWSG